MTGSKPLYHITKKCKDEQFGENSGPKKLQIIPETQSCHKLWVQISSAAAESAASLQLIFPVMLSVPEWPIGAGINHTYWHCLPPGSQTSSGPFPCPESLPELVHFPVSLLYSSKRSFHPQSYKALEASCSFFFSLQRMLTAAQEWKKYCFGPWGLGP